MTSLELGEGEVTDANAESEGIDPDSEINLKPKLIAGKRVHFSPVLSTLLNLQEMQCANHHVEEGSLEDDREIEDAVKKMLQDQKMVDDVYKQIEMWGEALGTSSSQEEDLSDIIPETSNSTPVVRMIRVSNIQKKSKIREPTLTGGSLVDSSKSSTKKVNFEPYSISIHQCLLRLPLLDKIMVNKWPIYLCPASSVLFIRNFHSYPYIHTDRDLLSQRCLHVLYSHCPL